MNSEYQAMCVGLAAIERAMQPVPCGGDCDHIVAWRLARMEAVADLREIDDDYKHHSQLVAAEEPGGGASR